jgi:DNA-binding Lrp family transcriptional regulator
MNTKLLKLLNRDSRTSVSDLAVMLGMTEEEVISQIKEMEAAGVIRGYKAVVDWERLDGAYVSAIIELKVTPKAGLGFEDVAAKVMKYPEVESVYLMSGVYDLNVVVKGKTFHEVAKFVAKELSTIESVTSTATHFVLRRYKEMDVELMGDDRDERGTYLL